jgi:polar amino acid transport system ATP-binding protein
LQLWRCLCLRGDMPASYPFLVAEGVTKYYAKRAVLRGIDLNVAEGEVVCIIGPSGSGKTTLLRCLALLEQPNDGRISLDGISRYHVATATSPMLL